MNPSGFYVDPRLVRQEYFGKLTRKIHSWFNQFNSDIKKESYFDVTLFFSW